MNKQAKAMRLSIFFWWKSMCEGKFFFSDIINSMLENEKLDLCSVIFERMCSGKCLHCIYIPCEKSSNAYSEKYDLTGAVLNIVGQLPNKENSLQGFAPVLVHAGRIISKGDLIALKKATEIRSDLELELINSGQYTQIIEDIQESGVRFQNLNISIDGTREIHNLQRGSRTAFDEALRGIMRSREILAPDGKLHIEFTLTKLNYLHVQETVAMLLGKFPQVSNIVIAPIMPDRDGLQQLELSQSDFAFFWKQLQLIFSHYNKGADKKVFFQLYRIEDLGKIALTVGKEKFWQAFQNFPAKHKEDGIVNMYSGKIKMRLDGVEFSYYPMSLSPTEGVLIDADGACRFALSQPYTLEELSEKNELKKFTVAQLNNQTNLTELQTKIVLFWMERFSAYLKNEMTLFEQIKSDG